MLLRTATNSQPCANEFYNKAFFVGQEERHSKSKEVRAKSQAKTNSFLLLAPCDLALRSSSFTFAFFLLTFAFNDKTSMETCSTISALWRANAGDGRAQRYARQLQRWRTVFFPGPRAGARRTND